MSISLCWLSKPLSGMMLGVPSGSDPAASLLAALSTVCQVWLRPKLNRFHPAAMLLALGVPNVNAEDVVGSVCWFCEVVEKDAPVIVLVGVVCVDVSPLDEEACLIASWLAELFLFIGECSTMFADKRALLALRVMREGGMG